MQAVEAERSEELPPSAEAPGRADDAVLTSGGDSGADDDGGGRVGPSNGGGGGSGVGGDDMDDDFTRMVEEYAHPIRTKCLPVGVHIPSCSLFGCRADGDCSFLQEQPGTPRAAKLRAQV